MRKEILSLEERALPKFVLKSNHWGVGEQAKNYVTLKAYNTDKQTYIKINQLKSSLPAWVFQFGLDITFQDLNLQVSDFDMLKKNDAQLEIQNKISTLKINLETSKFCLSYQHHENKGLELPIFELIDHSTNQELAVGDTLQSLGIFSHEEGIGCSFSLFPSELIYGGGEDFGSICKLGKTFDVVNYDALGSGRNYRYQSTPCFWSTRGYLWAILNESPSRIDFAKNHHEIVHIYSTDQELKLLVIPAANAKEAIKEYRQLFAPTKNVPSWTQKIWLSRCFYKDQAEVDTIIKNAREQEIPFGCINLDARTWMRPEYRTDFVWDEQRFEDFKTYIPSLREQGIHVSLWENPFVSIKSHIYEEGAEKGYFAKQKDGRPFLFFWVPQGLNGFPRTPQSAIVDFTNPEACRWWKNFHKPYLKAGVTCFKTDFGEEIPFEAQFYDGRDGWQLRNKYSDLYNLCISEVMMEDLGDEGVIWTRSGFTQLGQTPIKWCGDSQTSWRGLRACIRAGLGQVYGPKPDEELYLRWVQTALWASHTRLHGTSPREPWEFSDETKNLVRESILIREALSEYFINQYQNSFLSGVSFLSPMWFWNSNDPACRYIEDQFYSGSDVIVAPYLEATGGRKVYLPSGQWIDLRNGDRYEGPMSYFFKREDQIPVFSNAQGIHSNLFLSFVERSMWN